MSILVNLKEKIKFNKNILFFFQSFLFIVITIFLLIYPISIKAEISKIDSVSVEGNQRIETQTILAISGLSVGKSFSENQINQALLLLNASTFFEEVDLQIRDNQIVIIVKENPTINSINFEGNNFIKDENLSELISIKERKTFSLSQVERDAESIARAYVASGRLAAQVTPKIIKKSDNRIDLVFEITEGRVTEIEKITFIGNRNFSETRLRGVIATKQAGIFRSFMKSDTLVLDRLDYDEQLLNDFYINRGFINFSVISRSSELTRKKDAFLINFNIKEGQKYDFGKINIISEGNNIDLKKINKINKIKENSPYDPRKLRKLIDEIEINISKMGINFINISPKIIPDNDNLKVNIDLNLVKAEKTFVERIEIEGNSTTLDEVIRLKFDFVEGDPFDIRKIQEATDRVRGLGFFSEVSVNTKEGSSAEKVIIEVKLTEKATGSLGLGAGYNSSDGSVFTFNINERNFLGKGQTVNLALSSSSAERQLMLGLEDPSFLGRNLLAGISFGRRSSTPYSVPLNIDNTFFAPKVKFPVSRDSDLSVIYRYDDDKTKLISSDTVASPLITSDVGNKVKSGIILSYNLNKTNSIVRPTSGFNLEIKQELNGLGGDIKHSKTGFEIKSYNTLFIDDIILASDLSAGVINGNDANVSNRFSLGGDNLRGFRNYGIGPIDNTYSGSDSNGDPLGGKMFTAINLEASFPIGVPEEYGVFGGIFIGAGSVWGLDNTLSGSNIINDKAKIRSAAGVSLFWDTVIGPLRFNFSRPIQKEKHDITENFRFTVDTRF